MIRSCLKLFLFIFSAGCVSHSTPQQLSISSTMPVGIRLVELQVLPVAPGTVRNFEQPKDVQKTLAQLLKSSLEAKQPDWQIRIVDTVASPARGDIAVVTEVIEIDGGSAGLRFWIGFNAGAAQSAVRVRIQDKTGREVAAGNISTQRMCPIGACTVSNETMIDEALRALADEISEFVGNPSAYQKRHGAS